MGRFFPGRAGKSQTQGLGDTEEEFALFGEESMNFTPMRKLIVLCGPTHSGKSSFAKGLKNYVIINSDKIRKELTGDCKLSEKENLVWKTFSARKFAALKNNRNVVLDACHMSSRARWHALQGVKGNYRKICVVFNCPFREIKKRCLKENRINLETAREMWKSFQKSRPSKKGLKKEGFDKVYFLNSCLRSYVFKDCKSKEAIE